MLDVPKYRFTLVYMLFVTYFQSFSNLIGKFYDILKIRIKKYSTNLDQFDKFISKATGSRLRKTKMFRSFSSTTL